MNIEMIPDDIKFGVPCCAPACAITLAVRRCANTPYVVTYSSYIRVNRVEYPLPPEAIEWRTNYDLLQPVAPICFDLPITM